MAAADYRLITEATGQRIAAALESLVNLGDPVAIAHGGTGASTAAEALTALGGVAVTDIVDNLASTATNKPLSAAQGKALNDKIKLFSNFITPSAEEGELTGGMLESGYTVICTIVYVFGQARNINFGQNGTTVYALNLIERYRGKPASLIAVKL